MELGALKTEPGTGGGVRCPGCHELLHVSKPYGRLVFIVSLILSIGVLVPLQVRSVPVFMIAVVVIWIPLSLILNVASLQFKPPTLFKQAQRRKTFLEWLYERDEPPTLFDKRK